MRIYSFFKTCGKHETQAGKKEILKKKGGKGKEILGQKIHTVGGRRRGKEKKKKLCESWKKRSSKRGHIKRKRKIHGKMSRRGLARRKGKPVLFGRRKGIKGVFVRLSVWPESQ